MQSMPTYGPPPMYYAPARQPTQMPIIGGVFLILAAILGFIGAAQLFLVGGYFAILGPAVAGILAVCGILIIVFSMFALLGGVMAVQRKMWGLALVGGILGLFAIGPFFLASLLSLIGLILVGISKDDFEGAPAPAMAPPVAFAPGYAPGYAAPAYPQPMQPQAAAGGAWKFCSNCGNQVAATAPNCPRCGAKIA